MPWHHIPDPNSPELDELAKRYTLHPLHIEDCRSTNQRVKAEDLPDYVFVLLKPVIFDSACEVSFSNFNIFVGKDYCVTVGGNNCKAAKDAIARARSLANPDDSSRVLYRLFDAIVDGYLPAIDCIDDKIDDLEDVGWSKQRRGYLHAAGAPSEGHRHFPARKRHLIAGDGDGLEDRTADHALGLLVEIGEVVA